jgi:hypothetical protein
MMSDPAEVQEMIERLRKELPPIVGLDLVMEEAGNWWIRSDGRVVMPRPTWRVEASMSGPVQDGEEAR